MTYSERFFNTGEVAINYADYSGKAEPAYIFVHGLTSHHQAWAEVNDPIRRTSHAIAVDPSKAAGAGHSSAEIRPQSFSR